MKLVVSKVLRYSRTIHARSNYFKTQFAFVCSVTKSETRVSDVLGRKMWVSITLKCKIHVPIVLNSSTKHTCVDCFKKGKAKVSITPKCGAYVSHVLKKRARAPIPFQLPQTRSE